MEKCFQIAWIKMASRKSKHRAKPNWLHTMAHRYHSMVYVLSNVHMIPVKLRPSFMLLMLMALLFFGLPTSCKLKLVELHCEINTSNNSVHCPVPAILSIHDLRPRSSIQIVLMVLANLESITLSLTLMYCLWYMHRGSVPFTSRTT